MAVVKVKYTATFVQVIYWPDGELGDLTYENLESNIDPIDSTLSGDIDIETVSLNGEKYYF